MQDDITIVTSSAPDWLLRRLSPPWRIDFERLAQALRDPLMTSGALPLDGPVSIPLALFRPFLWRRPPSRFGRPPCS